MVVTPTASNRFKISPVGYFEFQLILYIPCFPEKSKTKNKKKWLYGNEPGVWAAVQSADCARDIRQYGPIARAISPGAWDLRFNTAPTYPRMEEQTILPGPAMLQKPRYPHQPQLTERRYAIGINITPLRLEAALINLAVK